MNAPRPHRNHGPRPPAPAHVAAPTFAQAHRVIHEQSPIEVSKIHGCRRNGRAIDCNVDLALEESPRVGLYPSFLTTRVQVYRHDGALRMRQLG